MAELEVTRAQQLYKGNAAPLKKFQQAQTDLATLRSQRSGLQKQLGSIGAAQGYSSSLAVRAPISGTVSKVIAQIGSNVDMASPIAEIVSNAALHLDIYVYEKDLGKAFHWYEKSADQGNAYASYSLARMYHNGEFIEKDMDKAQHYYKTAFNKFQRIELQDDNLWYRLGSMCKNGLGTEKDIARAIEYFKLSADLENKNAMCEYASELIKGENGSGKSRLIDAIKNELLIKPKKSALQKFESELLLLEKRKNDNNTNIKSHQTIIHQLETANEELNKLEIAQSKTSKIQNLKNK